MPPSSDPKRQTIQACMQSLRRIVKALEDYSRSVERRFGLTGPQLWALWELGRNGPLSLKELSARMHLDSSTVVGVVDRLVAKDLLVRSPDPEDRRRVSLALSGKGREIFAQAPHPAQGELLAGLAELPEARVAAIHGALHALEQVLHAEHLDAPFFFDDRQ